MTTNINNKTAEYFIREMDAALDIGDWHCLNMTLPADESDDLTVTTAFIPDVEEYWVNFAFLWVKSVFDKEFVRLFIRLMIHFFQI